MSIQSNFPNLQPSLLLDFANTKQLDNRVTFTRSTPAVYYDGETTAMAEQNLILNSQDIDNAAWTKVQSTVTANSTAAPDGTTTADTVTPNTTAGVFHYVWEAGPAIPNGVQTHSIYVKANGNTKVGLREGAYSGASASFDLTTVTVISQNNAAATVSNSAITSVGNGWYRISTTYTGATVSRLELWVLPNSYTSGDVTSFTWAGDGTSGVYLWGAQIEARSTLTAYTATTTQPITNYIPVLLSAGGNQARFDHNPTTGESLGLLIEEQRTNSFTYSTTFDSSAWLPNNATLRAGIPELNIYTIIPSTGNTTHQFYDQVGKVVTAQAYTISLNGKAYGYTKFKIADVSTGNGCWFDVSAGTVGTANSGYVGSIVAIGNGFYRCSVTFTPSAGTVYYGIYVGNTTETGTYAGNGFSGLYISSPQFEAGSFPTSYIATTSASATRTADAASMTGTNFSSWYNNAEWTLYTETTFTNLVSSVVVSIDDNSFNNIARIGSYLNTLFTNVYSNSAFQFNQTPVSSLTRGVFYKISFAAKPNSYAAIANTNTLIDQNSGILFTGAPFQMKIGNYFNNDPFTGRIKKIAYYPIRVSNTNVQALSS